MLAQAVDFIGVAFRRNDLADDPVVTIEDVRQARPIVWQHASPAPLVRCVAMEQVLNLPEYRRVWIKDYGWTPVGSFKLMGALAWMHRHQEKIGNRPVVAHSSGNFASGLAFAGKRYRKRVIIVMPQSAPRIKFERTRFFGAEIRTYDIETDHQTGARDRMVRDLVDELGAVQASPYDDIDVIAGNGVGGIEIAQQLKQDQRELSHFVCPISGGGLMAGHALAVADVFPSAAIIGIEPTGADDYRRSLLQHKRVRLEKPMSICDGLLSYDVGKHNWPILARLVRTSVAVDDGVTCSAMRWLYEQVGLRTEPSGAIGVAALLSGQVDTAGQGDIVVVISGRNIDEDRFRVWIDQAS
ncbi:threonine/serine dehydratase [bacterium]|nr:threonine/serine dehydratase [bacterium]